MEFVPLADALVNLFWGKPNWNIKSIPFLSEWSIFLKILAPVAVKTQGGRQKAILSFRSGPDLALWPIL